MSVVNTPESGVGITLAYKPTPTATTFTLVAWLKDDCEFSGFENAVIEIKVLASGNVTKVGGRTDNGSFTGTSYLVENDATVSGLFTLSASKILVPWQVQLNDGTPPVGAGPNTGTIYAFNGFVSSVKPGGFTGEDAATLDFEIAISGAITKTPAS